MRVEVKRKTMESEITIGLDNGPRNPEIKKKIKTPLTFFSHMLEQLAWRSELNLEVDVKLDHFILNHVVCEDVGIALGKAFQQFLDKKLGEGCKGYGSALAVIDESLARVVVSFENRAYLDLNFNEINVPLSTEGIQSEDLVAFWEGFVQGAQGTIHIDLLKGRKGHGHHHWESIFRAAGEALLDALETRPWRRGMTAGVAGNIKYEVNIEE